LLSTILVACSAYRYTPTTPHRAPPKPANCTFDLLTTRPDRPYDELGVVEPKVGGDAGSAREFIHLIRETTCQAGADAVLAEINGRGTYVRGTLIKYRADVPAAPVAAPAQPSSGLPSPP
jgi:hypothetical protein